MRVWIDGKRKRLEAAGDSTVSRKEDRFSAMEWVAFWLPGCSLHRVEEQ
jgi:hypothetical protein